ncbi:hypothetical protein LCGC14_2143910 [marine sediment metagenome]|uniref:Uncharacterized protein n=1 Tax=marine sediment metagenome TaxID=412755 RepID=A0A0F9GTU8_9ZZZZ
MAAGIEGATDYVKGFMPSFIGKGSTALSLGGLIIFVLVFLGMLGFGTWWFVRYLKYNKKIVVFEKIGGRFEQTMVDKAMEIPLSTAGDTVIILKKSKKIMPFPRLQMGRRVYWYFIREDREWINFDMLDLDEEARKGGARFLQQEARFARTQVQKGLKERYDRPGFWKQYGLLVISIIYIVVIGMMIFLALGKFVDIVNALGGVVSEVESLMGRADKIIGNLGNVCGSGSGYTQV